MRFSLVVKMKLSLVMRMKDEVESISVLMEE